MSFVVSYPRKWFINNGKIVSISDDPQFDDAEYASLNEAETAIITHLPNSIKLVPHTINGRTSYYEPTGHNHGEKSEHWASLFHDKVHGFITISEI